MAAAAATRRETREGRRELATGAAWDAPGAADRVAPRTSSFTLSTTFRQPGKSAPPFQPRRSAHWIWLNGRGGTAPSILSWTRVLAWRARSASARTHCERAASADHTTTTALADFSRSSITSA